MKRKKMTIWAIATFFTLTPLWAIARPRPPVQGERGRAHHSWYNRNRNRGKRKCPILMMYDRITSQLPKMLDLNESQIDKYNDIKSTHRQALKEICKQLEQERKSFKKDLESILTPEQQEKLAQLQKKMRKAGRRFRGARRQMLRPGLVMQAIKKMDISEDKAQQIKDILLDTRDKIRSANRGDREQMRKIVKDMVEQIKEILSSEEFNQLKEIVRDLQNQRSRGRWSRPEGRWHNRGAGTSERGMHGWRRGGEGRFNGPPPNRPERRGRPVPPPQREDNDEFLW